MFNTAASILIGLVISLVVVFDWSNCDKVESACFYALAIPGARLQVDSRNASTFIFKPLYPSI